MQNGALVIKIRGRDEAYWAVTLLALILCWVFGPTLVPGASARVLVPAVMAVFVAVRFTLLRNWNVRRTQWTADREAIRFDGTTILRKDVTDLRFLPSKGYSASWYLDIQAGRRIRLECLGAPEALRAESLESLKKLAIAIDPMLTEHPEYFPD